MKPLQMGKDMNIRYSVCSPPPPPLHPYKMWETFFLKKALQGGNKIFWENL